MNINNNTYETKQYAGQKLDMYYYKELLVDDQPKHTQIREYVVLEDGSKVGICVMTLPKFFILFLMVMCLAVCAMFLVATVMKNAKEPKSNSDITVIENSTEDAIVESIVNKTAYILKYNRYTILKDGYIDIMYQNIDTGVQMWVKGDDISCDKVSVKADEYIPSIQLSVGDAVAFPIRAELIVRIDGEDCTVPIVINDVDSVDYSSGESEYRNTETMPQEEDIESPASDFYNPKTYKDREQVIND